MSNKQPLHYASEYKCFATPSYEEMNSFVNEHLADGWLIETDIQWVTSQIENRWVVVLIKPNIKPATWTWRA